MKEFLTAKGVPFTNRDITEDPKAMEDLEKATDGVKQVPVIIVGDEVILGFDRTKLQNALGLN